MKKKNQIYLIRNFDQEKKLKLGFLFIFILHLSNQKNIYIIFGNKSQVCQKIRINIVM